MNNDGYIMNKVTENVFIFSYFIYSRNKMYVSAKIVRRGRTVSDNVALKQEYDVSIKHRPFVGDNIRVIAGPYEDYDEHDVYTVELLSPPIGCNIPYYNNRDGSMWEYVTISID